MDFSGDPSAPKVSAPRVAPQTAFLRVAKENHSTIAFKSGGPKSDVVRDAVISALLVKDGQYSEHCEMMSNLSEASPVDSSSRVTRQWLSNLVFRVSDSHGRSVDDYFIEFFAKQQSANRVDDKVTAKIQQDAVFKVHVNNRSKHSRSILIDTAQLGGALHEGGRSLHIAITASPDVSDTGTVGYSTVGYDDIGSIRVPFKKLSALLVPDSTTLVDLMLKRHQSAELFTFKPSN